MNIKYEGQSPVNDNHLIGLTKISNLDFTKLKGKISGNKDDAIVDINHAEMEYKRFLTLILLYPREQIVPTKEMDSFWHAHILDTRNYIKDMDEILGKYLHHDPYFGGAGNNQENWKKAFEKTGKLYLAVFNEPILDSKSDCAGDNSGAGYCCSNSNDY